MISEQEANMATLLGEAQATLNSAATALEDRFKVKGHISIMLRNQANEIQKYFDNPNPDWDAEVLGDDFRTL